jgi:hypothetical protein
MTVAKTILLTGILLCLKHTLPALYKKHKTRALTLLRGKSTFVKISDRKEKRGLNTKGEIRILQYAG